MPDGLRIATRLDTPGPAPVAILVDKPPGASSFGVVKRVRWAMGEKRVGHAGTLDPMATGLLIVLVGREATREQDRFMGLPKVYTATVRLGQSTASADAESPIDDTVSATHLLDADVQSALPAFVGEIVQTPPVFSAIKVGGERLYKKARRGEAVEVPPRHVRVTEFTAGPLRPGPEATVDVDIRVACSKGTYIRSLGRDLGDALGVGGHLVALRREAIGPFQAAEAWALDDLVATARPDAPPAGT